MDRINFEKFSSLAIFAIICLIAFALMELSNWILISDDLYYDTFGEQLSFEKIGELIDVSKKWGWLIYPILPLIYLMKFFLVAGCLFVGVLLSRFTISFKTVFKIVMVAEFVFLVQPIAKIIWFSLVEINFTLNDLQYFFPLSALSLVEASEIPFWLVYPLQTLSVFEVAYWFILAYGFHVIIKEKYTGMIGLVASSYGAGLLLWEVFIVFLSVSNTP